MPPHFARRRSDCARRSGSHALERELIAEGVALVQRAFAAQRPGPYFLQAAIAAVHSTAPAFTATGWVQITGLYDLLLQVAPWPVVEINHAVAVAMRDGPAAGLALMDAILQRGDLADYHLAHAAQADMYRRLHRKTEARAAFTGPRPGPGRRREPEAPLPCAAPA